VQCLSRVCNIARTQTLPLFVEEAYKQYQTQAAFSAAVLLAGLALVTLVLKKFWNVKLASKMLGVEYGNSKY